MEDFNNLQAEALCKEGNSSQGIRPFLPQGPCHHHQTIKQSSLMKTVSILLDGLSLLLDGQKIEVHGLLCKEKKT